jgi:hypothetical protein
VRREDPRAGEIDRFIDQYFGASEAQREVLDANMDRIMSVFMGDGEGEDAGISPDDKIEEESLEEAFLSTEGGVR